ncbi:hypothetical protein AAFF_G00366110 [Aldrovandia affinis]|uniref:Uncharacterized protein n=1 Tax=Aldrovandia affinis TaxID=143900 RepID=A0AAD7SHL6_9TELE|nr:hypothetical protein AAFF_G00366110 [Aldrovandia affinis]
MCIGQKWTWTSRLYRSKLAFCIARKPPLDKGLTNAQASSTGLQRLLSQDSKPQKLISVTVECFGRIDCLVNNAGWHPPHKSIDETTAEEFRDLLNFNLISYFLTAKASCKANTI